MKDNMTLREQLIRLDEKIDVLGVQVTELKSVFNESVDFRIDSKLNKFTIRTALWMTGVVISVAGILYKVVNK